jgi:hypothetical protein
MPVCRGCGVPIEPARGFKERVWCSDRCRKRATRARKGPVQVMVTRPKIASLGISPGSGGLIERVRTLVADQVDSGDDVAGAQGELAIELAGLAAAGSVSACRELRLLLLELRVASDPSWEGEVSEALVLEVLLTGLDVGAISAIEPCSLDWPPGWRSTVEDGELRSFLVRRWFELTAAGDLEALQDLEVWVTLHLDDLRVVRLFGARDHRYWITGGRPPTCV